VKDRIFKKPSKEDLEGVYISYKGALYRTKIDMSKLRDKLKRDKK